MRLLLSEGQFVTLFDELENPFTSEGFSEIFENLTEDDDTLYVDAGDIVDEYGEGRSEEVLAEHGFADLGEMCEATWAVAIDDDRIVYKKIEE